MTHRGPTNLVSIFNQTVACHGDRPFLGMEQDGQWQFQSYRQIAEQIDCVRGGLQALGVKRGDRVAIISGNRPEWVIAVYAAYGLGAVMVPMYEQQQQREREYILADAGARVCITSTAAIAEPLRQLDGLTQVICMEPDCDGADFQSLLAATPTPAVQPDADELALLSYTSGTTGNPKGVMLTHGNLASDVYAITTVMPVAATDRSLSFLPWAHLFGGSIEMNSLIACAASIAICPKVDQLASQLATAKPTLLFAVPRVWNKLYTNVMAGIRQRPAIVQRLFDTGLAAAQAKRAGRPVGLLGLAAHQLAERVIFSKVRAKLGGRLRFAFTGSAALSPEVIAFIDGIGIHTYEGYGMTETSGVATCNTPGAMRIGSVGKAIPGFRIELDHSVEGATTEQGEIIIHGPGITPGYYNLAAITAESKTADGGMRSGDLGRFDADGFLYVTGRVKELFKMANGKYVAPAPLEEALTLSPYIAQAMIVGANRPHNLVLLVPERSAIEDWAKDEALPGRWPDLLDHPSVAALLQQQLDHYGREFRRFERPRATLLIPEPFTPESGLLTPTLKIKRRLVEAQFAEAIDGVYLGTISAGSVLSATGLVGHTPPFAATPSHRHAAG